MYNLSVLPDFAVTPPTEEITDETGINSTKIETIEITETPAEAPLRRRQFNREVHREWRGDGWGN